MRNFILVITDDTTLEDEERTGRPAIANNKIKTLIHDIRFKNDTIQELEEILYLSHIIKSTSIRCDT